MAADSSHPPAISGPASGDNEVDSLSNVVAKTVSDEPPIKDVHGEASRTCSGLSGTGTDKDEQRWRHCPPLSCLETAKPDSTTFPPEVIDKFFPLTSPCSVILAKTF